MQRFQVHIGIFQEFKLKSNMNVNIRDYSIVSLYHPSGKSKGGTTLAIHKTILYQKQKFQYRNNIEYCFLKITNFDQNLFVHSI